MRSKLMLITLLFVSPLLTAQDSKNAGQTLMARGEVTATADGSDQSRTLQRRAPVFDVDLVQTGADSQAQFRMKDGALLALQSDTELRIAEYEQGSAGQKGSVVMELVKGGLRTVTGSIKGEAGSYELKTPVGSIGVRGTTFQVSYIGDILLVGVWNGAIELQVTQSNGSVQNVTFGRGQASSFASVNKAGAITPLSSPPAAFSASSASTPSNSNQGSQNQQGNSGFNSNSGGTSTSGGSSSGGETEVSTLAELAYQGSQTPLSELIAARSGSFEYSELQGFDVRSSAGDVSNFQANMTIDFDNGTVPEGQLSFNDQGGAWFAAFNGVINVDQLELGVNFASHGNNPAQGEIGVIFTDGTDGLLGQFLLNESDNSAVNAGGIFLLK